MKRKIAYSSTCRKKKRFMLEMDARNKCLKIKLESGDVLHHYKCNVCNGWHLTSMTSEERKSARRKINKWQSIHDKQYQRDLELEAGYWESRLT